MSRFRRTPRRKPRSVPGPHGAGVLRDPACACAGRARLHTARQGGIDGVTIVNQILATQYFGGRNPIGQVIQFPSDDTPSEIVGVVGNVRVNGPRKDAPPMTYSPLAQTREIPVFHVPAILVRQRERRRSRGRPHAIDPALQFENGVFVKESLESQLLQERMLALLSGFFGGLALLLACIGLYGLLWYALARRTTESACAWPSARAGSGGQDDAARIVYHGALGSLPA